MRGRSIHARSLLRQSSRNTPAIASASPAARNFISSCGSRSTRSQSRRASSVLSSSKSSSSSSSSNGGNSSSSGSNNNSSSASSSSSSASNATATEKHLSASAASPLVKVKASSARLAKASISPANPPPSSLARIAWENFFSNERPLLQHEMLPPRPKRAGGFGSSTSPSGGTLTAIFTTDGSLATFGNFDSETHQQWRRRMRDISPERFGELIDGLAGIESEAASDATEDSATRWLVSSFHPESDRVAVESAKLEEEERIREEEEEAVQNALERGEDAETARKLGAEADLIILGEPHGPSAEWSRGVATYLAEKGRAYEAPPAPVAGDAAEATELEPVHVSRSVFFTDDDPNLMLSHALVQSTLPLVLKWDKLVAQMDAVALNDPLRADNVVDTTKLDAKLENVKGKHGEVGPLLAAHNIMMDSVRRKRRKKIRKHKYKKLRKTQRAERQRMKK
ncbi:uncharacterized protein UBRO_06347 [Ustilago bromivora]|uniref:Small ribosomal subunit protein mS38 n=1 Tax=Ustilago bromivora TaxID=307758 RepID=A0A1K0H7Z4_9BASI|nr:uncharacterized protein UBRO_06347 [Ustilago bromivora]SYW80380.1 uncharacterized protein UBRO2_03648 [Ustilago bromivora]